MSEAIPAVKDAIGGRPVPTAWRQTLASIVARLSRADHQLALTNPAVQSIDKAKADEIARRMAVNGATGEFPDWGWELSNCQWQLGHWDVGVRLPGKSVLSGLTLLVRVRQNANVQGGYRFEVDGVR